MADDILGPEIPFWTLHLAWKEQSLVCAPPSDATAIIPLSGGRSIDLLNPDPDDIDLEDIAHGLSQICRFTGQSRPFYSVAEHSYHVSRLVPPEQAWPALLHDGPEAYLGDVSSPLKKRLPEYRMIEARFDVAFAERFGLELPHHPSIKAADLQMLGAEFARIFPQHRPIEDCGPSLDPSILRFWSPKEAAERFLARAREVIA